MVVGGGRWTVVIAANYYYCTVLHCVSLPCTHLAPPLPDPRCLAIESISSKNRMHGAAPRACARGRVWVGGVIAEGLGVGGR